MIFDLGFEMAYNMASLNSFVTSQWPMDFTKVYSTFTELRVRPIYQRSFIIRSM